MIEVPGDSPKRDEAAAPTGAARERLARPPIVEAVINLRVQPAPESGIGALERFCDAIGDAYPRRTPMYVAPGGPTRAESVSPDPGAGHLDGFALERPDGADAIHARLGGLSFSRLRDYESWEQLRSGARRFWDRYREVVRPVAVTRVALRVINRIELPMPVGDLLEYLRITPAIPPGVPRQLAGMFLRLVIHDAATRAMAIVVQSVEPAADGKLPCYFDIDVFLDGSLPPAGDEPWAALDRLRALRNDIFFGSVTEKALALFR